MNDTEVTLAVLGILATTIAAIIWVAKFALRRLSVDMQAHTEAALKQARSNDRVAIAIDRTNDVTEQTMKISKENLDFLTNLNGKLSKITAQTIQEQRVKHQVVEKVVENNET